MGQLLGFDNVPQLSVASTTSLTLAATNNGQPTRITMGGQQYALSSSLVLNTGTTGINGMDIGSLTSNTLYYVYAVFNGSVVGLVLSLSALAPAGFTQYANIGRVRTFFGSAGLAAVATWSNGVFLAAGNTPQIFTPVFRYGNSATAAVLPSLTTNKCSSVRNDESLCVLIELGSAASAGTNNGTGNLSADIPGGFSINPNYYDLVSSEMTNLGAFQTLDTAGSPQVVFGLVNATVQNRISFIYQVSSTANGPLSNTIFNIAGSGTKRMAANARIPIAEFAGLYT